MVEKIHVCAGPRLALRLWPADSWNQVPRGTPCGSGPAPALKEHSRFPLVRALS